MRSAVWFVMGFNFCIALLQTFNGNLAHAAFNWLSMLLCALSLFLMWEPKAKREGKR